MWCDELTEYLKQIGANKGQILAELERWPEIAEIYKQEGKCTQESSKCKK